MFIERESTEIVTIDEEIVIKGMSLQKSGLPITFDSMGTLWELYEKKYRGAAPVTEYGVCLNSVPDYITGCENSGGDVPPDCSVVSIPKGKYIKDTFNAESFEKLVYEVISTRDVRGWAKKNGVKINRTLSVEVYPRAAFAAGSFEMYTLTPIKE